MTTTSEPQVSKRLERLRLIHERLEFALLWLNTSEPLALNRTKNALAIALDSLSETMVILHATEQPDENMEAHGKTR